MELEQKRIYIRPTYYINNYTHHNEDSERFQQTTMKNIHRNAYIAKHRSLSVSTYEHHQVELIGGKNMPYTIQTEELDTIEIETGKVNHSRVRG